MPNRPVYPELTQAQWEVLSALTDQRCANILESADFVHDISDEVKVFLRGADKDVLVWLSKADKEKLKKFDANMVFMDNMAFMNKWLMKGIAVVAVTVTFFIGVYNAWKSK